MRADFPFARLASVAAAVLLAVAVSACGSSDTPATEGTGRGGAHATSTSTTTPASQVVTFSPYSAQGAVALGLQVTSKVSGHCTSPGVAGAASYRCIAQPDSAAYDPCFAPPRAARGPLVCAADPTDVDVVQFAVGALPNQPAHLAPHAWAMRLENGEVCILVRGAWQGLGPFACPTPSATSSLADCRRPKRAAHGWTSECQAKEKPSSPFNTTQVVNVWN